MSAAKAKAQNLINDNGVVVFSKSYCPYCKASKDLLTKLGAKYEVLELDLIGTWNACVVLFCWRKPFALCAGNGAALGFDAGDSTRGLIHCGAMLIFVFVFRGRLRYSECSPGDLLPAHCAQYLDQPTAHWGKL